MPPSKDENRPLKTKNLRQQTNPKVGGQEGHESNTLKMFENTDKIIDYFPDFCCQCGCDFKDVPEKFSFELHLKDLLLMCLN